MIETERQRQVAIESIQYWRASISAGEQSWIGQEQAQESIMALHAQVAAYDKREQGRAADSQPNEEQNGVGDDPMSQPAGAATAGGVPCGPGSS